MLREGFTYSAVNSGLLVKVIKIHHVGKRHTSARLVITDKPGNLIENKNYKLINANILHWYIYKKGE